MTGVSENGDGDFRLSLSGDGVVGAFDIGEGAGAMVVDGGEEDEAMHDPFSHVPYGTLLQAVPSDTIVAFVHFPPMPHEPDK